MLKISTSNSVFQHGQYHRLHFPRFFCIVLNLWNRLDDVQGNVIAVRIGKIHFTCMMLCDKTRQCAHCHFLSLFPSRLLSMAVAAAFAETVSHFIDVK